jgi:hypothetical protein
MLKSLDILIGLSVVMLIVSMAVTLVNQAILNAFARRGRCLREGLADLLQHLDWSMPRQAAKDVAAMVLTQPSIRRTKVGPNLSALFPSLQFGEVIHREELTKILLNFGSRNDEIKKGLADLNAAIRVNNQPAVTTAVSTLSCAVQSITGVQSEVLQEIVMRLEEIDQTNDQNRQQLSLTKVNEMLPAILAPLGKIVSSLATNGISDPGKTLDNVRMMALQFEKSNPELANDVRQSSALLQEASSPFLAKINFAFDQTMDRVAERFTYNARIVTLFSATLVALTLQLDTVYIFNRLSMDDKMRDALVSQAANVVADEDIKKMVGTESANKGYGPASTPATAPVSASAATPAGPVTATPDQAGGAGAATVRKEQLPEEKARQQAELKAKYYLNFMAQQGIINIAPNIKTWREQWEKVNPVGVFLSIILLSMGAPFWYKAISQLLQFRSILAQKDDNQRLIRQTTQTPEATPKPGSQPPSIPMALGERGDLNAVV